MVKLFVTLETLAFVTAKRLREEKGATAVEYGLMVGLIAVAIIITVGLLGGRLNTLFQNVLNALPGGAPAGGGAAG
jgi:pilus assembly protein Flp/PilA